MKKRKAYRPKPVNLNPLGYLRPASAAEKAGVLLRFHAALGAMARGEDPSEEDWRSLSDCVNTVETLALDMCKLVPAEVMPDVVAAIAGMVGAAKRFKAGKGMRLDGPGLAALGRVVAIYEQALDGLTQHEMAQAQQETQRRVNKLLRSKDRRPEVIEI